MATDLAEYLGAALGFNLLFGLPLWIGAPLTLVLVYVAILGQQYHRLERIILVFLAVIAGCYVIELFLVKPDWAAAAPDWLIPNVDGASILVALGMLGAIVMPHNIYLHSNVIQSRDWDVAPAQRARLMHFELADTTLAMGMGWLVNSAMIIVAAAVFFSAGVEVTSIEQASQTLEPLVGCGRPAHLRHRAAGGRPRLVGHGLAGRGQHRHRLPRPSGGPAHAHLQASGWSCSRCRRWSIIAVGVNAYQALIVSQVVLSLQLPFTIIPLLWLSRGAQGDGRRPHGYHHHAGRRRCRGAHHRAQRVPAVHTPSGEAERMGVYDHILVPIEGTETDAPVLEHVAALAAVCGATVTLLRVAHYHTRDQRELRDRGRRGRPGARRGGAARPRHPGQHPAVVGRAAAR